jgi:hypothetical protein
MNNRESTFLDIGFVTLGLVALNPGLRNYNEFTPTGVGVTQID